MGSKYKNALMAGLTTLMIPLAKLINELPRRKRWGSKPDLRNK